MSEPDYLADDYDPYQNQPGRQRPAKSSTNWTLIIAILAVVGLVCVLLCCGGAFYLVSFGTDVLGEQVRAEIEDNPVIQEQIGTISTFELDLAKSTAAAGDDAFVFRIEGDKGAGYLTVESVTVDADHEAVTDGSLKLDSGESFLLFDDSHDEARPSDELPEESNSEPPTEPPTEPESGDGIEAVEGVAT